MSTAPDVIRRILVARLYERGVLYQAARHIVADYVAVDGRLDPLYALLDGMEHDLMSQRDTWSSNSRQHQIETGEYLTIAEAVEMRA